MHVQLCAGVEFGKLSGAKSWDQSALVKATLNLKFGQF